MQIEKLSPQEIKRGIFLALENADELSQQAYILFKSSKYSGAYALYQLGMEEVGKSNILFNALAGLLHNHKDVDWKSINKGFWRHTAKSERAIGLEKLMVNILKTEATDIAGIEDWGKYHKELSNIDVDELDKRKNDSLYVGFSDGKFRLPKEVITKEMVEEIKVSFKIRFIGTETVTHYFLDDEERNLKDALEKVKVYFLNSED